MKAVLFLIAAVCIAVATAEVHHVIAVATVCDQETADKISAGLVNKQLAAEVHIVPGVKSVYRKNDGDLKTRSRVVLQMRTRADLVTEIKTYLRQHLDLTDLTVYDIMDGSRSYFEWQDARMKEPTPVKDPSGGEPEN